jgi:hypothetical protein
MLDLSKRGDCGLSDRVAVNLIVLEVRDGLKSLFRPFPKKGRSLRRGGRSRPPDSFDPNASDSGMFGRLPEQVLGNGSISAVEYVESRSDHIVPRSWPLGVKTCQ